MQICGLQKTTLLDYPGKVASTIFLGGCNMRCPFCHNMNIVEDSRNMYQLSFDDLIKHLSTRTGVIDGICITGGEPTLQPDLIELISVIKEYGYSVKLDSNGTRTGVIEELINLGLVDYIAIDVKSSFNNYPLVAGFDQVGYSDKQIDDLLSNIKNTIELLINQDIIPYEFRTTVVREYHDECIIDDISKLLKGAQAYYLQSFINSAFVPNKQLHSYTKKELQKFALQLSKSIDFVDIRGI